MKENKSKDPASAANIIYKLNLCMKKFAITVFAVIKIYFWVIILLSDSSAQQLNIGIRIGLNNSRKESLHISVYEIYLQNVPPITSMPDTIFGFINIASEAAIGVMRDKINCSLLFSIGPTLKLINYKNIVSVSSGIKPSLITNRIFNDFDFGGIFNFKSHISFTISPSKEVYLGFRFEHISNAGLYEKNPGVNFHYVEFVYVL